ncbi:MAG: hypothetical protein ABI596_00945 [Pyrinomonadaceae bacterium]
MSAQTPFIPFDPNPAAPQVALRARLRGLSIRLRLWRGLPHVAIVLAVSMLLLWLLSVVDYLWPMPLTMRVSLLASIVFTGLFFLWRTVHAFARARTLAESAREVERAAGLQDNAVTTFAEVSEHQANPGGRPAIAPYMAERLQVQARLEFDRIEPGLFSSRRLLTLAAVSCLVAVGLLLASRLLAPVAFAKESRRLLWLTRDESSAATKSSRAAVTPGLADFVEVRLRIEPPRYTGLPMEDLSGESSVRALAGSRIEVNARLGQNRPGATLAFNGTTEPMGVLGDGLYGGSFTANSTGALEVRTGEVEGRGSSVIRSIEVYPDASPEARITQPASDQLLSAVPAAPISVRWTGRDDLGLAAVSLKYVKSRGEGDAAKFSSGEVSSGPVEKSTAREWRGMVSLNLATLDVRPGDTLVYWMEARDHNPAAGAAGRSASMLIAIAAPDAPRLNVGELRPNDMGRFLLTQRLIINHTEKLNSERQKRSPADFKGRSNDIAAEQRDFRNSFDDFIKSEGAAGGDGDEHSSVAERARAITDARMEVHDHGIPEPPAGAPAAVRDFIYAIRAMWDAEDQLVNADTIKALQYEREALALLKRAQSAVRYVPRVVAQNKPLDLKRRYAGELDEIKTRLERLARRLESKEAGSIRSALTDSYGALRDLQSTLSRPAGARVTRIAGAAKQTSRAAQSLLASSGGDHAPTIAQAAGQLRVVESELLRLEQEPTLPQTEFEQRLAKPLALLARSISELFAIAEQNSSAASGTDPSLMPAYSGRAADYFRRLAEHARR